MRKGFAVRFRPVPPALTCVDTGWCSSRHAATTTEAVAVASAPDTAVVSPAAPAPKRSRKKAAAVEPNGASSVAVDAVVSTITAAKGRSAKRQAKSPAIDGDDGGAGEEEPATPAKKGRRVRKKKVGEDGYEPAPLDGHAAAAAADVAAFGDTPLKAAAAALPPLPVPNLGYCCLNVTLRNLKPPANVLFCNRLC